MKDFLKNFPLSLQDTLTTFFLLLAAVMLGYSIRTIPNSDAYVYIIFIMVVFLVARFTDGYFYGCFSSLFSLLLVDYIFTNPYFGFSFTFSGYVLTLICMLTVAVMTTTLTMKVTSHMEIKLSVEKEKIRSNLLRAISHDLRTPLTSIYGASSAIIENDDLLTKAERLKLLSEIRDDSQWLIRMVENLLSVTRIDGQLSTKIIKQLEPVEEIIAETVRKFRKNYPAQQVQINIPEDLLMVPMDGVLIGQVIMNLLENAVIHSESATEITLTVSVKMDNVFFEVADNGCGIDNNLLPYIFEGYSKRVIDNKSDTSRNMGIGLSVCYTIIKAHNGDMIAYNRLQGGAAFCFTLPLTEEEPVE